jgi:hypothetical protein
MVPGNRRRRPELLAEGIIVDLVARVVGKYLHCYCNWTMVRLCPTDPTEQWLVLLEMVSEVLLEVLMYLLLCSRNSEAWVSKSYDSVVVRRFWVLVGFGAIAGNPIRIWSLVQSLVLLVSG